MRKAWGVVIAVGLIAVLPADGRAQQVAESNPATPAKPSPAQVQAAVESNRQLLAEAGATLRKRLQDRWDREHISGACADLGKLIRKEPTDDFMPYSDAEALAALNRSLKKRGVAVDLNRVAKGRFAIGDSSCQAFAVLGEPDQVNRTVTAGTESEQLVYERRHLYVYATNGRISAWQD